MEEEEKKQNKKKRFGYFTHIETAGMSFGQITFKLQHYNAAACGVRTWELWCGTQNVTTACRQERRKHFSYLRRKMGFTWSMEQKIWASSCWKRRTRVRPVRAPDSSFLCSTPKSAIRMGSSLQERGRWSNMRLVPSRQIRNMSK